VGETIWRLMTQDVMHLLVSNYVAAFIYLGTFQFVNKEGGLIRRSTGLELMLS
jgi:hypothetical protein